jgi:hypothetical protein
MHQCAFLQLVRREHLDGRNSDGPLVGPSGTATSIIVLNAHG